PPPARRAGLLPAGEVLWAAADGDAAVRHPRAADELPPRQRQAPAAGERLRGVAPVVFRRRRPGPGAVLARERPAGEERGWVRRLVGKVAAPLEQEDVQARLFGEPGRERPTCAAGADDDDV